MSSPRPHKLGPAAAAAAAAALLALASAAQAQTVIVQVPENAAELRAAMDASLQAARTRSSVGMISGRANPQASRDARTGAISLELDASTLMHSVARIGPDGTIERVCVAGTEMADKALSAPAFAKRLTPKVAKEAADVK